jgi:hypothetical protein
MGPSAPFAIPALDTANKVRRKAPEVPRSTRQAGSTPQSSFYFAEFFAGQGGLTKAMLRKGIRCREADEVETKGGIDFRQCKEVAKLKVELRDRRTEGATFLRHFAPPCSTFSRARDRAAVTRLRSTESPEGSTDLDAYQRSQVTEANEVALQTLDLAIWAAKELSAVITLENPAGSYM